MIIIVTDPAQRVYQSTLPQDVHFALFKDGLLLNEGDEFTFGPDAGEITLSTNPIVGDELDFRRL